MRSRSTARSSSLAAKNQELTGMRYEQFTRSVLLAQGAFADFLEAKDDERAVLLERMTGTAPSWSSRRCSAAASARRRSWAFCDRVL